MFFVGGTALRFFYTLPRFSEDLDRGVLYANNIREEPKKNSWPCISEKKTEKFIKR
jgi:predicted nucleotidyltransferase component of viral defense system